MTEQKQPLVELTKLCKVDYICEAYRTLAMTAAAKQWALYFLPDALQHVRRPDLVAVLHASEDLIKIGCAWTLPSDAQRLLSLQCSFERPGNMEFKVYFARKEDSIGKWVSSFGANETLLISTRMPHETEEFLIRELGVCDDPSQRETQLAARLGLPDEYTYEDACALAKRRFESRWGKW
jgi:hypothetical protein